MSLRIGCIFFCLSLSVSGVPPAGADPSSPAVVLIPVAIRGIPGAYGSLWQSELYAVNAGAGPVVVETEVSCVTLCPPVETEPGAYRLIFFSPQPGANPGLLAYLTGSEEVRFNLRVQDLSRQSQTWGTEIPVVRANEMKSESIHLLNVPTGDGFRQTIRVYLGAPDRGSSVRVVMMNPQNGVELGRTTLVLQPGAGRYKPAYAQLDGLPAAASGITVPPRVALRIDPLEVIPFWAFVSITNNETQHVTTITPQP